MLIRARLVIRHIPNAGIDERGIAATVRHHASCLAAYGGNVAVSFHAVEHEVCVNPPSVKTQALVAPNDRDAVTITVPWHIHWPFDKKDKDLSDLRFHLRVEEAMMLQEVGWVWRYCQLRTRPTLATYAEEKWDLRVTLFEERFMMDGKEIRGGQTQRVKAWGCADGHGEGAVKPLEELGKPECFVPRAQI